MYVDNKITAKMTSSSSALGKVSLDQRSKEVEMYSTEYWRVWNGGYVPKVAEESTGFEDTTSEAKAARTKKQLPAHRAAQAGSRLEIQARRGRCF